MSASAKFSSQRSCNDDYVPVFNVTRSTCHPNKLQEKYYENVNPSIIRQYTDANIKFGTSKGEFTFTQSQEPDARLEAIDAKLEATEVEFEKILNGSEDDIIRPSFDDDRIKIEDEGLHHYHYMSIYFFNLRDPVNVFAKTTMSDDDETDDLDYFEAQEREIDKYENY